MISYSNNELVRAAKQPEIIIRNVFCGTYTGHWTSKFLVNRLVYVFELGREESLIRDKQDIFVFKRGHWVFIPAGHEISHNQKDGVRLISVHFNVELYSNLEFMSGCRHLYQGESLDLLADFESLLKQNVSFKDVCCLQELLWRILRLIAKKEGDALEEQSRGFVRYTSLLEEFKRASRRNFSVADMAKIMKMGKESFIKHFKTETGIPPKEFFNRIRAATVARELLDMNSNIREVSLRYGFSNEFYLSRFMKRFLGVSPREYRRIMTGSKNACG